MPSVTLLVWKKGRKFVLNPLRYNVMKCSFPTSLETQNSHLAKTRDAYACIYGLTAFSCEGGCSVAFGTGSWRASSATDLREVSLHFGLFHG